MSFWGRMFGSETRAANLRLSDPRLAEFFGVHGSSGNVTPDNVLSNLAVAASCVALRSELMASVSLFLFRRTEDGGRERASDNPLYGVLHDLANPNMTAFEARELMIRSLDLTGKPREMRVRLKGINSKTRVLSDGTKRTYWYAWKGGPRIEGEPGTPEFMVSYNAAVSAKVMPTQGVMLSIMQAFQADDAFRSLADSTKRDYVRYIKLIETAFGDFPLDTLTDRLTRGELTAWRNTLALRSRRQADYAWSVLARILSWSLGRGLILANPCERGGRLYRAKRTVKVWTDDDEATFLARAPRHLHLHLPLSLALWTGQRQGDLIRLTWSAYDGKTFRL